MHCPRCGAAVSTTDNFCENCGCSLSDAPASSGAPEASVCLCPPGASKPDEDGYCQVCGVRCIPKAPKVDDARKHVEVSIDERLACVSDVGRRHLTNEDAGNVVRDADGSVLLIVADGVTSALNSANASQAAVEASLQVIATAQAGATLTDTVRSAIAAADQAALTTPFTSVGSEDGPETTIVIALRRGKRVAIGWVGDSRAYLIGPDFAEILTVDDSWVEEVVQSGSMTREQAEADIRAHYVTQVLGMRDQKVDGHVIERELPDTYVVLLCSDGLWNYFEREGELAEAVRSQNASDALSLCRWLVDTANERGGHDNVTVAALIENPTPNVQQ